MEDPATPVGDIKSLNFKVLGGIPFYLYVRKLSAVVSASSFSVYADLEKIRPGAVCFFVQSAVGVPDYSRAGFLPRVDYCLLFLSFLLLIV